jgi:16S rRNA (uracil1498-N3)-methyltransferase
MPTIPRLYVDAPLFEAASVTAGSAQAHYLANVLRRSAGSPVHLFNGRDGEWVGQIAALKRDRIGLTVERLLRPQAPEADLWLCFAPLKRDTTDMVVQKATELGASALLPVFTERTNAARVNEARLTAIAIEAAEQSERLTVPVIHPPAKLPQLLDSWHAGRRLAAALERSGAPFLRPVPGPAALLVGPEGGFSHGELDLLGRYAFVAPVSLGPRILRAETACLAGLILLQAPECG